MSVTITVISPAICQSEEPLLLQYQWCASLRFEQMMNPIHEFSEGTSRLYVHWMNVFTCLWFLYVHLNECIYMYLIPVRSLNECTYMYLIIEMIAWIVISLSSYNWSTCISTHFRYEKKEEFFLIQKILTHIVMKKQKIIWKIIDGFKITIGKEDVWVIAGR